MISLAIGQGRPIGLRSMVRACLVWHVLSKGHNGLLKSFARDAVVRRLCGHELIENSHGVPHSPKLGFSPVQSDGQAAHRRTRALCGRVLDGQLQHEGQIDGAGAGKCSPTDITMAAHELTRRVCGASALPSPDSAGHRAAGARAGVLDKWRTPLEGALLRADGAVLYPIRDGIPVCCG
jgi:uncharacterized protein YbaR (Trm112 family)